MNESATTTPKACELWLATPVKGGKSEGAGSEGRGLGLKDEICLPDARWFFTARCCWPAIVHARHSAAAASASYSWCGRVEPATVEMFDASDVKSAQAVSNGVPVQVSGFHALLPLASFTPVGGFIKHCRRW